MLKLGEKYMNRKMYLVFFIINLFIFICIGYSKCYCHYVGNSNKVLIIGSYSADNKWENSILKGFEESNDTCGPEQARKCFRSLITVPFIFSSAAPTPPSCFPPFCRSSPPSVGAYWQRSGS